MMTVVGVVVGVVGGLSVSPRAREREKKQQSGEVRACVKTPSGDPL
jgi:hypothetical protein